MNEQLVQAWCELNDPVKSALLQMNAIKNLKDNLSTVYGSEAVSPAVCSASILVLYPAKNQSTVG